MKREESDKVIAELSRIIGEALGGNVEVQVLKVEAEERKEEEDIAVKQVKAIQAIDQRIAQLGQVIDKLRQLQMSIAQPNAQRKLTTTMREIMLAMDVERMIQAL